MIIPKPNSIAVYQVIMISPGHVIATYRYKAEQHQVFLKRLHHLQITYKDINTFQILTKCFWPLRNLAIKVHFQPTFRTPTKVI